MKKWRGHQQSDRRRAALKRQHRVGNEGVQLLRMEEVMRIREGDKHIYICGFKTPLNLI